MAQISVVCASELLYEAARDFAATHNLSILPTVEQLADLEVALVFSAQGLSLVQHENNQQLRVAADFDHGSVAHRRQFGGGKGQMIAKAVGVSGHFTPRVLDATAGLGRDAFVLATLGVQVTLLERSAIVHALLNDGLGRARIMALEAGDHALTEIIGRMHLMPADSLAHLGQTDELYDVVYLDPMFPERKKTALVKKEMRIFHHVVGSDDDADALLAPALARARYRVVVKRPKLAPFLNQQTPSYQLKGKSSRFDIYTLSALPKK